MANMREHDRGRAAGDAERAVMLGDPEPPVYRPLRSGGERARFAQRFGRAAALADRHEVEDRQRDHCAGGSSAVSEATCARYERALAAASLFGASSITECQLASAASWCPASIAMTPASSPTSG